MRARRTVSASTACARHSERRAECRCDDCAKPMCADCAVEIPDIGTLCSECALRRSGVHHGGRTLYVDEGASDSELGVEAPGEGEYGAQLFEAMVGDREPHNLISGLTERLEEAGADPADVVDEDELQADVARLQASAEAAPRRRRWWQR